MFDKILNMPVLVTVKAFNLVHHERHVQKFKQNFLTVLDGYFE